MNRRLPTRRPMLTFAIFCFAVVGAFLAGRYHQRFQHGRRYAVHDSRSYESGVGTFYLRHVTDECGWQMFDLETSVIALQTPPGCEVTLYRAKRLFQETWPSVDELQIDGNDARWTDGELSYSLHVERVVAPATQPK